MVQILPKARKLAHMSPCNILFRFLPGAKSGALSGPPFSKNQNGHHFSPIMYDTTFYIYFGSGNLILSLFFTIWHEGDPHSGGKIHISRNVIFIQSYNFVSIFCMCELNVSFFRRSAAILFLFLSGPKSGAPSRPPFGGGVDKMSSPFGRIMYDTTF